MVQCEMCGTETATPKTVKIEGAELDVCDDCADFGTEVTTEDTSSTSTKYSTSTSSGSGSATGSSGGPTGSTSSGGGRRQRDMFDEMDELAADYGDRIRNARESEDLSQSELGSEINEKASLIRKLERADILPSDDIQRKLERRLNINLTGEAGESDDSDWNTNLAEDGLTLGDKVERRDS